MGVNKKKLLQEELAGMSYEQMSEFLDAHDLSEYEDELQEVQIEVKKPLKIVHYKDEQEMHEAEESFKNAEANMTDQPNDLVAGLLQFADSAEKLTTLMNDFNRYQGKETEALSEFTLAHTAYNKAMQDGIGQLNAARALYDAQTFEMQKRKIADQIAEKFIAYADVIGFIAPKFQENFTKKIAALECAISAYEIKLGSIWISGS